MVLMKRGLDGVDESAEEANEDSESGISAFDESLSDGDDIDSNMPEPGSDKSDSNDEAENEPEAEPDEEDELVRAIQAAKQVQRDHPPDIITEDAIVDICFHPTRDLLAVATMTGDVAIYEYTDEANQLLNTHELHTKACRDIEFSEDGSILFSSSKDKSIMLTDMETGKLKVFFDNAHDEPIYCLRVINENLLTSGDDGGVVRMWDIRQPTSKSVFSLKISEDYVSDMLTNSSAKFLVCSSGDGALTTINMNARKIHVQSVEYESELTCLGLFRNDTKIMAGSSKGKMYLFNWGEFGMHSDEFSGPKQSISCMVPITENIVVMSGEDGILRATNLFPHKHLGVVGQHTLSVENVDICRSGQYIASSSHNNDVKFWNISYFEDMEVNTSYKKQNKKKDLVNNLPSSKARNASDFFAGMS